MCDQIASYCLCDLSRSDLERVLIYLILVEIVLVEHGTLLYLLPCIETCFPLRKEFYFVMDCASDRV